MLTDQHTNYEVTVLCTEYDRWQTDIGKKGLNKEEIKDSKDTSSSMHLKKNESLYGTNAAELLKLQTELSEQDNSYRDSITIDESEWHGARVVRLNLPAKLEGA